MTEQRPRRNSSSDEIEVGQLFEIIGNAFRNIFIGFLKFFLFVKGNIIILVTLLLSGVAIAVILNHLSPAQLKTEAIVKPNFESKDYLYDVIEEIKSNIALGDTVFLEQIGLNLNEVNNLHIEIVPIESKNDNTDIDNDIKYLQVLKDIPNDLFAQDILKSEILKKSVLSHRITFSYKDAQAGAGASKKLLTYINETPYFNKLKEIYVTNANTKIEENKKLIAQVDGLIEGYSNNLDKRETAMSTGAVVLETERGLDIPTLLNLKNSLIKENERKKLEIVQQNEVIKILSLSRPQSVQRKFFEKRIVKFPLILIVLFLFYSFFIYLNKASRKHSTKN